MISEIVKAIKAHLYERATSPLAGALILSWCLWNYPVLIVLFSALAPQQKIELIQSNLINHNRSVWGPLITSGFFIFVYPYPARFVYWFWRKQKKELRDIRQKIEDEELLSKEESRTIRREMYSLQLEYDKELERKDNEIKTLKGLVEEKEKEKETVLINAMSKAGDNLKKANQPSDQNVNVKGNKVSHRLEMLKILKFISEQDNPVSKSSIVKSFNIDKFKMEYYLGELVNMKYLETHFSPDLENKYIITHLGRKYLIESGGV